MNIENVKTILNSQAGQDLKDYLISKLDELKDIDNLKDLDTPTYMVIEIKAQKKAYRKLKEIFEEITTFSEEPKKPDPRDSFKVE